MSARETPNRDFLPSDRSLRATSAATSFQQHVVSPPVALSLRTRESSALALKHIFDQISSTLSSPVEAASSSTPHVGSTGAGARASGSRKDCNDEKRKTVESALSIPEDKCLTSCGRSTDADRISGVLAFLKQPAEDRTLIPLRSQGDLKSEDMKRREMLHPAVTEELDKNFECLSVTTNQGFLPSIASGALQFSALPEIVARPSSMSPNKQSTAQLTIFYSGTIHVYDDVPADKADAIMLLADSGNSGTVNRANDEDNSSQICMAALPSCYTPVSNIAPSAVTSPATSRPVNFNIPLHSSPLTPIPQSPSVSPVVESKGQLATRRTMPGIELPHARKASLARFLEKRKDRVQLKPQISTSLEKCDLNIGGSESPTKNKRHCISRSQSPNRMPSTNEGLLHH